MYFADVAIVTKPISVRFPEQCMLHNLKLCLLIVNFTGTTNKRIPAVCSLILSCPPGVANSTSGVMCADNNMVMMLI